MSRLNCKKCGSGSLIRAYVSLRCPICGEYAQVDTDDESLLWAEHRLGLTYGRGGWGWMSVIEPPAWFATEVM